MKIMFKPKRDTMDRIKASDYVVERGIPVFATDENKIAVGDGVTIAKDLSFVDAPEICKTVWRD